MGDERAVRYFLDVLWPGRRDKTLAHFAATTPFQAVQAGDILHTQSMLDAGGGSGWMRVVGVVHRIWELTEHISHLTTLYTVAVTEEEALSFGGAHVLVEPTEDDDSVVALEAIPLEEYGLEEVSPEELAPDGSLPEVEPPRDSPRGP